MNLLILWSPLADYTVACFRALSVKKDIDIHIVYQDASAEAPFLPFDLSFCRSVKKYRPEEERVLIDECIELDPDVIIMASWNYSYYKKIARKCRSRRTFVLSAFDSQWEPTWKQRIGVAVSPFYIRPFIDNFFVPGDRQAKFARKLGYENPLTGYYSANTSRFLVKREKLVKKFLYVGRLIEIKGIRELIKAYQLYRQKTMEPWELIIAGTGPLKDIVEGIEGITVKGFVQPGDLPELFAEAGCLILPSHAEPWGVVIHEAVVAGLIIMATYKVGATTWFLRDGINGKLLSDNAPSIEAGLSYISHRNDLQLASMSQASETLGMLWTTEKWADYVYDYFRSLDPRPY